MPEVIEDQEFVLTYDKFYQGHSPTFFQNDKSEFGNPGHANAMQNINILDPTHLTQGPALAKLTNGDENGAVDELIRHILEIAVSANVTYGIGATKLFKITANTVSTSSPFPYSIPNATQGQSVVLLKGEVYAFYNKSSGGDILKLTTPSTIDPDWGSAVPTGKGALQKAPHPSAAKEDTMLFGNGRYAGIYKKDDNTLELTKLDFGSNSEVADVGFDAGQWLLAVNSPNLSGSNRNRGQIYYYAGAATTALLNDEAVLGVKRIGWIKVDNGIVYLAYEDLSLDGFKIGYISGKRIVPIGSFTGALPSFAQKSLYENTIIFLSGAQIWTAGNISEKLPTQTSHLSTADYSGEVGAISAPFGTPMIASGNGTKYKLSKFSGYKTDCNWTSLISQIASGKFKAYIEHIIVTTNELEAGSRVDITVKGNQENSNKETTIIINEDDEEDLGEIWHEKRVDLSELVDVRLYLDFSNGSASKPLKIRKIELLGLYKKV